MRPSGYVNRAAIRAFGDGGGTIVNMSSVAGLAGSPGNSHYSAAKAGIIGLTRSLGRELAGRGIRVNAVAPGSIDTPMSTRGSHRLRDSGAVGSLPMGRPGTPDEVAQAILYLASDQSTYITGEVRNISGGYYVS